MLNTLTFCLVGGLFSRWIGSGWNTPPFKLTHVGFASAYFLVVFFVLLPTVGPLGTPYPWYMWYLPAIAFTTAFIGKITGHGVGIGLGHKLKKSDGYEKVELVSKPLRGRINDFAYRLLVLFLTEFIVVSGTALVLANPLFLLAALGKPLAYSIGYLIRKHLTTKWTTEVGEFLTGFFGYFSLSLLL